MAGFTIHDLAAGFVSDVVVGFELEVFMCRFVLIVVAYLFVIAVAPGCRPHGVDGDGDGDTNADGDGEADGDGDSDADGDGDSDADGDADSDADGDADSDADGDGDSDADGDGDSDADGDSKEDADGVTDADDPVDPCLEVVCDVPPPDICEGEDLRVHEEFGTCEVTSEGPVCVHESSLEPCPWGCDSGACADDPAYSADVWIYVDNFCNMTVDPLEITVEAGRTVTLTYHNLSEDYPVDVWPSYIGGITDLEPGRIWEDGYEWCAGDFSYEGYADISTACSSYRLPIHCL